MNRTDLADALGLVDRVGKASRLIALVGAGGKTSAMFSIAGSAGFSRVMITTTTHIRDPRLEKNCRYGDVFIEPALAFPHLGRSLQVKFLELEPGLPPCIVASDVLQEEGKLCGINPVWAERLKSHCDILLVEADGSRGRPIKAPGEHEPVIPPSSDIVIGLIGLDCIGVALNPVNVHRPELLSSLVGCVAGFAIEPCHVAALVRSPLGLFKGAPPGSRRVLLLNKADKVIDRDLGILLDLLWENPGSVDLVIVAALAGDSIATARNIQVIDVAKGRRI